MARAAMSDECCVQAEVRAERGAAPGRCAGEAADGRSGAEAAMRGYEHRRAGGRGAAEGCEGVPRCDRQPFRAPQEARHMPQMAQLADFMRFQAYGAAPAAVRA